jgi:hypothetical protein
MRPEQVLSPQTRIRGLRVVFTNSDEGWSIAEMEWRHHGTGEWRRRVGMRWDGAEGELGNPQSSGHPTWFLVPEGDISQMILEHGESLARQSAMPRGGDNLVAR